MEKAKIKAVFDANTDCALATIQADGSPSVAIVGFADTPELELIIGTSRESRKYTNITENSAVAVAIGWSWEHPQTVQYEGVAHELSSDELTYYQGMYFQKQPNAKQYADLPTQVYFVIKPKLIRYTDFSTEPDTEVIELQL